jgi:O-antigen/teichoic acid export membrane protein
MGFVIWTWLFSSFLEVASVANREPKLSTIFIVAAQMTKTLLMAAAVLIFADVESFLYAALFQGVLQTIVLLVYLNFRFPSVWRAFDLGFFKEHLIYAIPFGAAAMLWILQSDIHRYFVGNSFTKEEYAVYAIGCFQLPLLTLMVESVTSVMIPRMSRLQAENDMRGMIELSTSAMQKLAFFLFPVIGFLALTAHVFIITLNTRKFEESVPLFLVNLMVWPFYIIVTDPISRAFEDLGRPMLFVRITFFVVMIAFLFYGIAHFSLLGMMMIVVVMAIMDRLVQAIVAFRRIGVSAKDLGLLSKVGKTAVASGIAFAATWLLYQLLYSPAYRLGSYSSNYLSFGKADVADLVAGLIILSVCGAAFGVVYLITAFRFGTVEEEVRQGLFKLAGKFRKLGGGAEVAPVGDRVSS